MIIKSLDEALQRTNRTQHTPPNYWYFYLKSRESSGQRKTHVQVKSLELFCLVGLVLGPHLAVPRGYNWRWLWAQDSFLAGLREQYRMPEIKIGLAAYMAMALATVLSLWLLRLNLWSILHTRQERVKHLWLLVYINVRKHFLYILLFHRVKYRTENGLLRQANCFLGCTYRTQSGHLPLFYNELRKHPDLNTAI